MPLDGELLGDPRLRNGCSYYPAVFVGGGIVVVGNVVQLKLRTEAGKPYVGYGHLTGIWLWRDQPWIRVQYLAPMQADAPEDAIVFSAAQAPGPTGAPARPGSAPLALHPHLRSAAPGPGPAPHTTCRPHP